MIFLSKLNNIHKKNLIYEVKICVLVVRNTLVNFSTSKVETKLLINIVFKCSWKNNSKLPNTHGVCKGYLVAKIMLV